MAGAVLAKDTSAALAVLDSQSEAGKDLMRLLAELIAHLRNLLVLQVNPASVSAETGSALAETLRAQAAQISTDHLLELIDGFAAVEGRMKWAPNKKLHFEIGLIKAVQTLGQSTLTEVIDALTAIREAEPAHGASSPASAAPLPMARRELPGREPTAPARSSSTVAETPPRNLGGFAGLKRSIQGGTASPAAEPKPAARETPKPVETPKLAPVPMAPPAVREAAAAPAKPAAPAADAEDATTQDDGGSLDSTRLWGELMREVRSQSPLKAAWVQAGRVLGLEGSALRVGFPSNQRMALDSLSKPNTKKSLEGILAKLAARPVSLKLEVLPDDGGTAASPAGAFPGPGPGTAPSNVRAARPTERQDEDTSEADGAAPDGDPTELFKNDPLIQKALKIFEGEIRAVE